MCIHKHALTTFGRGREGNGGLREHVLGYLLCSKSILSLVSLLTFPIPGFSFTLETARSRHGGAGGGETCRIPLKLVG